MFLLEGFPSVLVAVWAWDFIPDGPGVAKWLTPRQREVAVLRLRQEEEEADQYQSDEKYHSRRSRSSKSSIDFRELLQTLRDPKCYLTAAMFFCCNVAFSSMPVFLPTVRQTTLTNFRIRLESLTDWTQIIRDMGYESITAQGLSAPPYLFAFVAVIITAYYSDRLQNRSTFIIMHSVLATLGYATIALCGHFKSTNTALRYLALYPATAGFFSAITIIITWTLNNQETDSKKGTGIAIMNIIGQMGPLVGTSAFPESDGPFYVSGMSICAASMLCVGVLAVVLRWVLARANSKGSLDQVTEYACVPLEDGGSKRAGRRQQFRYML